ncbi:LLM class flavin-dependent oxidoreductase [Staphylococcus auricularis]|uniref:LLM class flavin-dependent oxidoreductase n=1 Tax=Staphylococcus auricularis TaxID=29379 RepID=A0ABX5IG14_9STAP|nr:LLM class flavin-dependent oxidoreductase [Staphylococcus auricularis]MCE5039199.1 LLM class flavin-dependent oxidoreductase [Staphylococcus auricularis]MEB6570366.1 LLM class flavin-dependent oxidoreductase [Staphylococcus auricularis]PTH19018.1 LLM class flavin-dependent oxidoreductase [Staphylococcus auricularis]PTH26335.1 LLM class flavin-dependent oxidoreductase [Staphylococcus auricularis]
MTQNKKRQMHIGMLLLGCGHHQAAWLMPDSSIEQIGTLTYYQNIAQLAERGYFDAIFFADNQAFNPSSDLDMPTMWYDPIVNLTAIAQVTHHVGLVATISSTFSNPFTTARQLLTLDHMTEGRVGWNLVTSMTDEEARNHSLPALPEREERYAKADEFASVMNQLLTSWHGEDFVHDRATSTLIHADHIQPFHHHGKYFQVDGPSTAPQSPQSKPVAMQAGASKQGVALAAKYADAVYSVSWNLKQARQYRDKLDQAIADSDRPEAQIQVFPGLVTYVAETKEAARAKKQALDEHLPIEAALDQLSFFVGQDCSQWALDEPVPELPPVEAFKGPVGRYETVLEIIRDKQPTVRELLGYLSAGGGHLTLIGTPESIVDEMEHWFNEGVADGFNLMLPTLPGSLEDFVNMIVPELQRRGLYRESYPEHSTFRTLLDLDN